MFYTNKTHNDYILQYTQVTSTNLTALLLVLCEEGIIKERTHVTSVRVKYWLWGKSNERSRSVREMVECLESDDLRGECFPKMIVFAVSTIQNIYKLVKYLTSI